MFFKDIPFADQISAHLLKSFHEGRIPHARLFNGKEGSAALPLALAYARLLNCKSPSHTDSCGECSSCKKMDGLVHPDVHFSFPVIRVSQGKSVSAPNMDIFRNKVLETPWLTYPDWINALAPGENKQTAILIDEAKEILKKAAVKSFEGGYKVFIVWLCERLNTAGSNVLLKLLEEPPEKTVFLFVSSTTDTILPTVLSRLSVLNIPESVVSYPEENNLFFEKFVALMRTCWGVRSTSAAKQSEAVLSLLDLSSEIAGWQRAVIKRFLEFAMRMVRENLVMNQNRPDLARLTEAELDFSGKFSAFIHTGNAGQLYQTLSLAYLHIDGNVSERIVILDTAMQMVRLIRV